MISLIYQHLLVKDVSEPICQRPSGCFLIAILKPELVLVCEITSFKEVSKLLFI